MVRTKVLNWLKWTAIVLVVAALTLFAVRVYDVQRGPSLEVWHTYLPRELTVEALDRADWRGYLENEARIFEDVRAEVSQKLTPDERVPINRYFEGSPVYPPHFSQDFNRSFILEPDGPPRGVVVLLHGLTDSPYSQRHIARVYRDKGFVALVIRLPGHGTVPAGLTAVTWEDWMAATRLAVREARRRVPAPAPLHLVGFSNGGALAVKYALDAIENPDLARPDRIVLISPMIGITRFARFAGLAGLPAIFPAFSKAAWLAVLPEFNPFKYNSFPVNGARESYRLTQILQQQISDLRSKGRLGELAPLLTFQSVMDFTVSTPAIISGLYAQLPSNGSELVLFDVNRTIKFGPLLRPSADTALNRLLPQAVRPYRITVIANEAEASTEVEERSIDAGGTSEQHRPLGLSYPPGVFSLSHVALPFPMNDALYGMAPDGTENFGPNLGALAPRGERNVLITSLDALLRVASNPFHSYMLERIREGIDHPASPHPAFGASPPSGDAVPAPPLTPGPMYDQSDLPP
ncbi:carboxylesterase [Bradyrhizobium lablabi]|uniref:alpha/beta hydrolase n=1 Tax=Bradyrhizobium lablabi TaxID=722472 RepID=UPI001BA7AD06|nr:alpha/beta hydrolase [Bradyrhizobium lablabi]MBR0695528.1 alpha/beta hydrolase [Bradyrhizobium lablabi]